MKTIVTCTAITMAMSIVFCISCNKPLTKQEDSVQNMELQMPPDGSLAADTVSARASSDKAFENEKEKAPLNPSTPLPGTDWDKKIIKTADITLELKDYKLYNANLHKSLKGFGAYVADEEQSEGEDRIINSVIIKVPVDLFEDLLNTLPAEGVKLISKKIHSDDVTTEVVDTKSRIEAKKQVRARYIELLKQAKNMADILQVQQEINAIQEDLESATGRVNYLVHQSAYSTINLSYYQYLNGTPKEFNPTFFTKLSEAFANGSVLIKQVLLFAVTIWPLVLLSLFAYLLVKKMRTKPVKVSSGSSAA